MQYLGMAHVQCAAVGESALINRLPLALHAFVDSAVRQPRPCEVEGWPHRHLQLHVCRLPVRSYCPNCLVYCCKGGRYFVRRVGDVSSASGSIGAAASR